jgi:anaphase-promoting complex subunit 1
MEKNIMKTAADLINIKGNLTGSGEDGQGSGNSKILDFLKNRFSSDTRFKEVMSMLNSSTEIIIKLENIANRESLAEEALNTEKQKLLDKMFLRHLSKSVGRGAVTFGTVQNLPTETLHIPKIN